MDDYVPCKNGSPTFIRANGNELWAIMMEKAYAKVHGSYERTSGGWPHHAMNDLTGAPAWNMNSDEVTADQMLEFDQKGYMMCAGVSVSGKALEEKQDTGIANRHAYGVIAVKRLEEPEVTLVQVRNPWGHYEWNGDWSDNSELWTDELKEEVGLVQKDDGVFWISFEDFQNEFKYFRVCKVNDDYSFSHKRCQHENDHFSYVEATVTDSGPMTFSVMQKDQRCFSREEAKDYSYCYTVLKVVKVEDDEREVVAEMEAWPHRDIHLEIEHLEAGSYFVFAQILWRDEPPIEFTVTAYGESTVEFGEDLNDQITLEDLGFPSYA